jgi:tRNA 2-thiouridine synthesizing protein C
MARSMLIIARQAPWAGTGARDALDIALAGAAFELPISLLFLDDGVLQLMPGQQPEQLQLKNLQANLRALPMFGVEQLYVAARSLTDRGLPAEHLALQAEVLDDAAIRALIAAHDQVVTL